MLRGYTLKHLQKQEVSDGLNTRTFDEGAENMATVKWRLTSHSHLKIPSLSLVQWSFFSNHYIVPIWMMYLLIPPEEVRMSLTESIYMFKKF